MVITDFTAGEISPRIAGRFDLASYHKGCKRLENFIPFLQGGISTRPGLKHIGAAKSGTLGVRLVAFNVSAVDGYLLEMGVTVVTGVDVGYLRIWHNDTLTGTEFTSAVPTTFPYNSMAKINAIQFAQDGCDLYFAQKDYSPRLLRLAAGSFSMGTITITGNEFSVLGTVSNGSATISGITEESIARLSVGDHVSGTGIPTGAKISSIGTSSIVISSAATGAGTSITVSKLPFQAANEYPGCVAIWGGRLWFASSYDNPQGIWASEVWEPGTGYTHFHYFDTITTSTLFPKPAKWEFTGTFSTGAAKITGLSAEDKAKLSTGDKVSNATMGNRVVTSTIYDGAGTTLLASDEVCIDSAPAGSGSGSIVGSLADDDMPEYFYKTSVRDTVTESHAISMSLASDQLEEICWMAPGEHLTIGAAASEFIIPRGVSALTAQASLQSRFGSAKIQGRMFDQAIVFAQGGAKQLKEYYPSQGPQSPDLTFLAEHILTASDDTGIVAFDFSQSFQPMLYCVRSDGSLAILVRSREYGISAWCRVKPAGWAAADNLVKTVAVVVDPAGSDATYLGVYRGGYVIEKFDSLTLPVAALDSYELVTKQATNTILRFAGKAVSAVKSGVSYSCGVADGNGTFTIPTIANGTTGVAVGLAYTCSGETTRIRREVQSNPDGVSNFKRVVNALFLMLSSYSFEVSAGELVWDAVTLSGPYSGDINVSVSGSHQTDPTLSFRQTAPLPVTILGIAPEVV